jgi:hypothetical protein
MMRFMATVPPHQETSKLLPVGGPAVASSVWRPDKGRRSGGVAVEAIGGSTDWDETRFFAICEQGKTHSGFSAAHRHSSDPERRR